MNFYAHQIKGFDIGNFINVTPAIKLAVNKFNTKMPVYFEDEVTASAYKESAFIRRITQDEIKGRRLLCTSRGQKGANIALPDWLWWANHTRQVLNMEEGTPHTFIDHHHPLEELKKFEPFCVILRGCSRHNLAANGQGALFERKDPGTAIYQLILKDLLRKGITPILLGTDGDLPQLKEIVKDQPNTVLILNSMKKSLAAIKQSVGVIANDTGLYHASVALRKKTFVLWKNTPFEKNRAPGEEATFAFENNYKASYYHWIEEIKK